MKTFNIFSHPTAAIEAVKVGFSWPAFFFGSLWMLDKGLWGRAASWLVGYSAVKLVATLADKVPVGDYLGALLIGILAVLALVAGANGNRWWEQSLVHRKYRWIATVPAPTPEEAIIEYLDQPNANWRYLRPAYTIPEGKKGPINSHDARASSVVGNRSVSTGRVEIHEHDEETAPS